MTTSGSYVFAAGISETIGDGNWHHYAATVGDGAMTVYVDGAELASETLSEPLLTNDDDLHIGRPAYSTTADMFVGALDEVILREGAMGPAEVEIAADADTQFCTGDEDTSEPDAAITAPGGPISSDIGYVKVVGLSLIHIDAADE